MRFNEMWFYVLLEHRKDGSHNFILGHEVSNLTFVSLNPRYKMRMDPTNLFHEIPSLNFTKKVSGLKQM